MSWQEWILTLEVVFILLGALSIFIKGWTSFRRAEGQKAKDEVKAEVMREVLWGAVVSVILIAGTSTLLYGIL